MCLTPGTPESECFPEEAEFPLMAVALPPAVVVPAVVAQLTAPVPMVVARFAVALPVAVVVPEAVAPLAVAVPHPPPQRWGNRRGQEAR